jgi:hypothetical protein
MELNELLNRTADHIVSDGTQAESLTLQAMASAVPDLNRGAAAALVDWNGSEIARLRAFGIVHGVLLRELEDSAREELLTHLLATSTAVVPAVRPALSAVLQTRGPGRTVHAFNWRRLMPVKKLWHQAEGAPASDAK